MPIRKVFGCQSPKAGSGTAATDWVSHIEDAGEHADDIAIDNGFIQTEGHRGDRAGSVASDAWQGEERVNTGWHSTSMFLDNQLSCASQISCTPVVPQPFPDTEHILLG